MWCGVFHHQILRPYFCREHLTAEGYRNYKPKKNIVDMVNMDFKPDRTHGNVWWYTRDPLTFRGKVIGRDWTIIGYSYRPFLMG